MIDEIWKPLPIFPNHEVSNLGRVRCIPPEDAYHSRGVYELKQYPRYAPRVQVGIDGKHIAISVAKAVLLAFIGECPPEHVITYADGNKSNCALSNLSYRLNNQAAQRERAKQQHERRRIKTAEQIAEIKRLRADGVALREIARRFNVHYSYISYIASGKRLQNV